MEAIGIVRVRGRCSAYGMRFLFSGGQSWFIIDMVLGWG